MAESTAVDWGQPKKQPMLSQHACCPPTCPGPDALTSLKLYNMTRKI